MNKTLYFIMYYVKHFFTEETIIKTPIIDWHKLFTRPTLFYKLTLYLLLPIAIYLTYSSKNIQPILFVLILMIATDVWRVFIGGEWIAEMRQKETEMIDSLESEEDVSKNGHS